ncbi:MAG: hypothetical protein PHS79_05005 [Patescibacteria group bacterium]|nr:hypothetical protein [Patescibacteria group bacterium]
MPPLHSLPRRVAPFEPMTLVLAGLIALVLTGCGRSDNRPSDVLQRPVTPERFQADITWPADKPDELAFALLPPESQAAVAMSPVPVLLPRQVELLRNGKLISDAGGYAFAADYQGRSVYISATKVGFHVPGTPVVEESTSEYESDDGRFTFSWTQFGAAYEIIESCAQQCTASIQHARSLASISVFVGGKGAP